MQEELRNAHEILIRRSRRDRCVDRNKTGTWFEDVDRVHLPEEWGLMRCVACSSA